MNTGLRIAPGTVQPLSNFERWRRAVIEHRSERKGKIKQRRRLPVVYHLTLPRTDSCQLYHGPDQ